MRIIVIAAAAVVAMMLADASMGAQRARTYTITAETVQGIEEAAPDSPLVEPARPRKVLVYGRMPTHPESVVCCFKAMEILGKKTGAFEAVLSGNPTMFLPENLEHFDAVVMNNTHERHPMLPQDMSGLSAAEQAEARTREPLLKKSLLRFISEGKGIVGVHGATAGNVQWPEFVELFGAQYNGHFTNNFWVTPTEPDHPLVSFLDGKSFEVFDEFYFFRKGLTREPFSADQYRVLLRLDVSKTDDPGRRDDKNYAVTWIRPYGTGRIFYCSLGHTARAYMSPAVLKHYLAGIQYAVGDLKADASVEP